MAFVFLNQYLDIADAVEEGDPGMVDNSIFQGTDVPVDYSLPESRYLTVFLVFFQFKYSKNYFSCTGRRARRTEGVGTHCFGWAKCSAITEIGQQEELLRGELRQCRGEHLPDLRYNGCDYSMIFIGNLNRNRNQNSNRNPNPNRNLNYKRKSNRNPSLNPNSKSNPNRNSNPNPNSSPKPNPNSSPNSIEIRTQILILLI
jgi:hypothetical protein